MSTKLIKEHPFSAFAKVSDRVSDLSYPLTLRKKCPYLEFLWSIFSRIWTEYGEIWSIYSYSVQMRENTDQEISEYRQFSRSVIHTRMWAFQWVKNISFADALNGWSVKWTDFSHKRIIGNILIRNGKTFRFLLLWCGALICEFSSRSQTLLPRNKTLWMHFLTKIRIAE